MRIQVDDALFNRAGKGYAFDASYYILVIGCKAVTGYRNNYILSMSGYQY